MVDLRSDHRHRRAGDGEGGVQLGQARLRRRRRQRHDGRSTRPPTSTRRRATPAISKTNDHGSGCSADGNLLVDASHLRPVPRAAAARGRLSRQRATRSSCCSRRTGTTRAAAPPTPSRGRRRRSPPRPASRCPPDKTFFIVAETHIGKRASVLDREARRRAGDLQVPRLRRRARQGAADLRDRRQGPLVRHLLVRRRPHPSPGAGGAGEPHHGAPGAVALERRHVHQRHADDLEHGLRHLGRQHHQRERRAQALHERDLGEPADSRRQAVRSRTLRRVLQQRRFRSIDAQSHHPASPRRYAPAAPTRASRRTCSPSISSGSASR